MAQRRKTVLLVWELGAGAGHVETLLAIGNALHRRGCDVVFAVRDLVRAAYVLRAAGFRVVQAPLWPGTWSAPSRSYADILARNGFVSAAALHLMTEAWQDLYDLVRPDLIVADHAPTAILAAYGAIPVVAVGDGFVMPPPDLQEFPVLDPEVEAAAPQSDLLAVARQVQDWRGRPAPEALPALFATEARAVLSYAELDPYADYRREPLAGRIEAMPPCLPRPKGRALFAYLGIEHPELSHVIEVLGRLDATVTCYLRGDTGAFDDAFGAAGITVLRDPADLSAVLPQVAAVASYGSAGFCHAALAAGRPQLVFPYDLEKRLTARAIERLEVGIAFEGRNDAQAIGAAAERLFAERGMADRAAVCAQTIQSRAPTDTLARIVALCEAQLAS
jgi:UDP:flavonoid glycosyltransferase YjiC (YdhE family)